MRIHLLTLGEGSVVDLRQNDWLGAGAAGDVYTLSTHGFPGACVKIYKNANPSIADKLKAMIQRPPKNVNTRHGGKQFVQFAWPTHLVRNDSGEICGFAMPEFDFKLTKSLVTYTERGESTRELTPEQRSLPRRVSVVANLCALMDDLHRQGHAFVDFKDQNVQIYPDNGLVGFIDTDGFRIQAPGGEVFPGLYTTPTFNSPESVNGAKDALAEEHDRFVLAIMLFRILSLGIHPFQGVPLRPAKTSASFDLDQHIRRQVYPYGPRRNLELGPVPFSLHEFWDAKTLAMFERTFNTRKPHERVSAADWVRHFRSLERQGYVRCRAHPQDIEHVHFEGNRCPICAAGSGQTSSVQTPLSVAVGSPQGGITLTHRNAGSALPQQPNPTAVRIATQPLPQTAQPPASRRSSQSPSQTLSHAPVPASHHTSLPIGGRPLLPRNGKGPKILGALGLLLALVWVSAGLNRDNSTAKPITSSESEDAVADTSPDISAAATSEPTVIFSPMAVAAINVNVRAGPSIRDAVVTILHRGTSVQAAMDRAKGDFVPVRLDDGTIGWIGQMMIITVADAQRLSAIDASKYFENNKARISPVLRWANAGGGDDRPQLEIDLAASIWFMQNAKVAKQTGDLAALQDAYLAVVCADPLAADAYIGLGFVAFELGSDLLLHDVATIAINLDGGTTNTYTLKGLDSIRKSSSDPSKMEEARAYFETAISLSGNIKVTHAFLRGLASRHSATGMPDIVEQAIVSSEGL